MTRRQSREQAFVLVFEKIFNPELTIDEIIEASMISDDILFPDDFAKKLAAQTIANVEEEDSIIGKYSKGWKTTRLSKVSLSILRLALCELMFFDDIPDGVSVNEAVELAKKYSSVEDASYINGILGSYIRGKSE